MRIRFVTSCLLIILLSGCSGDLTGEVASKSATSESTEPSTNETLSPKEYGRIPDNNCWPAYDEDLKLVTQGMINSKYSVGSGFMAIFPPSDIKYIVAPPQNYVIAGTIRGIEGDSVIGLWGIWKDGNDDVRIFALNKQTQKYSIALQSSAWLDEVKANLLQLSVDTNLISCFKK